MSRKWDHKDAADLIPTIGKESWDGQTFKYVEVIPIPPRRNQHDGGLLVKWGAAGIGFGEFTAVKMDSTSWSVDSETMGKRFIKAMFAAWVDEVMR